MSEGQQPRYLIRDRDRSSGGAFIGKARAIGIKTVLTAVRTPQANAIAERVVGTLRRECLDHLIIVNERHLRATACGTLLGTKFRHPPSASLLPARTRQCGRRNPSRTSSIGPMRGNLAASRTDRSPVGS